MGLRDLLVMLSHAPKKKKKKLALWPLWSIECIESRQRGLLSPSFEGSGSFCFCTFVTLLLLSKGTHTQRRYYLPSWRGSWTTNTPCSVFRTCSMRFSNMLKVWRCLKPLFSFCFVLVTNIFRVYVLSILFQVMNIKDESSIPWPRVQAILQRSPAFWPNTHMPYWCSNPPEHSSPSFTPYLPTW